VALPRPNPSNQVASGGHGELGDLVGASVSSAFFASLERCSCINLSIDDDDYDRDDEEKAKDRPLILSSAPRHDDPTDATTTAAKHADLGAPPRLSPPPP
jgi:hypothetical protein